MCDNSKKKGKTLDQCCVYLHHRHHVMNIFTFMTSMGRGDFTITWYFFQQKKRQNFIFTTSCAWLYCRENAVKVKCVHRCNSRHYYSKIVENTFFYSNRSTTQDTYFPVHSPKSYVTNKLLPSPFYFSSFRKKNSKWTGGPKIWFFSEETVLLEKNISKNIMRITCSVPPTSPFENARRCIFAKEWGRIVL